VENKAIVVGALGVIGRYIVERLVEGPDWQVVGLSRRKTTDGPRYRHIAVDLLDAEDTKRKLAELTDVTHVFYAAFQAMPGSASNFASNIGPNREMLVNSVTAINRATSHLKRVVLVTGTKYYGVHLGPLKTPMREPDPRHMPPNYYFDQIDWLTAYQRGKGVGLGGAPPPDPLWLFTRLINEHPSGNRGLRCDIERTRIAPAFSGQAWCLRHDLPGD
jgi:nucleoside-diphosphate-sugar epimerase